MVFFNYSTMQMAAKVVYYGPGLCGKTTNLQWIFDHTSNDSRGEMVSLATETDRTLFFDLLPIDVGSIAGFSTRIQLYTVPGQVFYNTTRKLVLKGVDGVVFVADSQRPMLQANIESFQNLEENLAEMGLSLDTIPVVLQYNKRDLPNICTPEELDQALNRNNWASVGASALNGDGVLDTLKTISKATLMALKKRLTKGRSEGSGSSSTTSTKARPAPPRKTIPAPPQSNAATSQAATPQAATPQPAAPQPAAPQQAASQPAAPQPAATQPRSTPQPAPPRQAAPKPAGSEAPVAAEAPAKSPPTGHSTGPIPMVAQTKKPSSTHLSEDTAVTHAGLPPTAPTKRKKRAAGFDALAELEKLRKETVKGSSRNGKHELNQDFRLTLKKSALARAQRFSLIFQLEDADSQVVDKVQKLHFDIDNARALDRLLLRLNIDLDPTS